VDTTEQGRRLCSTDFSCSAEVSILLMETINRAATVKKREELSMYDNVTLFTLADKAGAGARASARGSVKDLI
jgi:hypothetical protein